MWIQAKDWEGKGKMKPHKSRLELAKEAAALCRCADRWPRGSGRHAGEAVSTCLPVHGMAFNA